MNTRGVAIKGTEEGLVITLGQGELPDLLSELERVLEEGAPFFEGGQVALQVGSRELSAEEIERVEALLARYQVSLGAVKRGGLHPRARTQMSAPSASHPQEEPKEGSSGLLVHRTLRSGQVLRHPGHVVIIGDVNPGAEVIAGGDVVVWGKLRGVVHAGASGDEGAVVCALQLAPIQLRIAGHIARPPDSGRQVSTGPEMASIQRNGIVVEPWMGSEG